VDQRELVERAGHGDHDAFAELVRGAIARLDATARLILRDPELARDAVQEALVGAWRDLPGLRDPDRLDAWLHRLIVHSCLDMLRRRRRRPQEVELGPFDSMTVVGLESDVADREVLNDALRHLNPELRALIVVHYFLDLPLSETAEILGIPTGTAKSRLNRALAAMRVAIDGEPNREATSLPGGQLA
jgi:RNA polymerase sigma factor (sigma-70 family)